MSQPAKIPWYRLHVATCVVLMFLAVVSVLSNVDGHQVATPEYRDSYGFGWPLRYVHDSISWGGLYVPETAPCLPVPSVIVVNSTVCLVLAIGTAAALETLLRRGMTRGQFTLSFAVTLLTTIAILLGDFASPQGLTMLAAEAGLNPSILFWEIPVWLSIPLYAAIVCTMFVAVSLALRLVARVYARFAGTA